MRGLRVLLVVVALVVLSVADSNMGEKRRLAAFGTDAMARAHVWFEQNLTYSQDGCFRTGTGYTAADWGVLGGCRFPSYRTDCSGFVSMAWGLSRSYATPRPGDGQDLGDLTEAIDKDQLSTGDALVAPGKHVRLFEAWTDSSRTRYRAYDFGSTPVKHQVYMWNAPGDYQYTPVRYIKA